jgi:anti-anti-sigma factor
MEITVSREQGRVPVTILHVKGEINAETSDEFLAAARKVHDEGAGDMLLDLSDVPYISSWGIRALSDLYTMLREGTTDERFGRADSTRPRHLKLLCPTPQVQRVLSAAGLDLYLESFTDRKQAVASYY